MSDHHANPDRLKRLRIRYRPTGGADDSDYCFLVAEINRRDAEIARLSANDETRIAAVIAELKREMMTPAEAAIAAERAAIVAWLRKEAETAESAGNISDAFLIRTQAALIERGEHHKEGGA